MLHICSKYYLCCFFYALSSPSSSSSCSSSHPCNHRCQQRCLLHSPQQRLYMECWSLAVPWCIESNYFLIHLEHSLGWHLRWHRHTVALGTEDSVCPDNPVHDMIFWHLRILQWMHHLGLHVVPSVLPKGLKWCRMVLEWIKECYSQCLPFLWGIRAWLICALFKPA